MRIAIIGAGMAGLACAERLIAQGHEVRLFDKGRGPGGRMSTRRVETAEGVAEFDHGAQYFTVRDQAFRRRVEAWIATGCVAAWPAAGNDAKREVQSEAYVGVPAMSAPLREMAQAIGARFATQVTRLERHAGGFRLRTASAEIIDADAAVLALPAEQAAAMLALTAPDLAAQASAVPTAPCWTVLLAFSQPLATAVPCWRGGDTGILAWAARNSSKPGRSGPESWVLQAPTGRNVIWRPIPTGSRRRCRPRCRNGWAFRRRRPSSCKAIAGASPGPARRDRSRSGIAIAASASAATG